MPFLEPDHPAVYIVRERDCWPGVTCCTGGREIAMLNAQFNRRPSGRGIARTMTKTTAAARHLASLVLLALVIAATWPATDARAQANVTAPASAPTIEDAPAQAQAIMPLAEVRIGMKGYGLSVFHGTQIETFPVEVISVMNDFGPRKGAIWIRCPDPRMQKSGPVQGMSGSPIYLWEEGETRELGNGGRLIGAFAFGYGTAKDCYVGVQPIEYMRQTGDRAVEQQANDPEEQTAAATHDGRWMVNTLLAQARQRQMASQSTYRLEALARAFAEPESEAFTSRTLAAWNRDAADASAGDEAQALSSPTSRPSWPMPAAIRQLGGEPIRMMLPVPMASSELASWMGPLLEPMGLAAFAAPHSSIGNPPPGIDKDAIRFAPGSVLSIPLAFGDVDLNASGTVTDVLPDGTVLGFGHAMFGQGKVALPLATGYTHFVQPSITTSFKLSGSAAIRGSLVRDESAAVVGMPRTTFTTAPVHVEITVPGNPMRAYDYEVVHHPGLTPMAAAIVTLQSLTAEQDLPPQNTIRLTGELAFEGTKPIKLNVTAANADQFAVLSPIITSVGLMGQNPFEQSKLLGADLKVTVESTPRATTLVSGYVPDPIVRPGSEVGITLRMQPYNKPHELKRITLKLPDGIPDGQYEIAVTDAQTYLMLLMSQRPHLTQVTKLSELHELLAQVNGLQDESLYVTMALPEAGLAIGRQELPVLPSSQRALLGAASNTMTTAYRPWLTKTIPLDMVPSGALSFTITVDRRAQN